MYKHHQHNHHGFPFGLLLIGFVLFMVFGWKLLFIVPVAIFFMVMLGCMAHLHDEYGDGKRGEFSFSPEKPKREPEYFEDDNTVIV